jgi:hypothetical protein
LLVYPEYTKALMDWFIFKVLQLRAFDPAPRAVRRSLPRTLALARLRTGNRAAALKLGKKEADQRTERSLYQRANGYSYDAVKIFMPAEAKKQVYAPYVEHVPPDPTSAIF